MEKESGNVFVEFEEGKINFHPTYKYKVGTHDYDEEKVRIPSWCDRILYRGESIEQLFYTSVSSPTISDHKPVCSLLKAKINRTDPGQKRNVTKSIHDYLQTLKDSFTPKIKISTTEIVF